MPWRWRPPEKGTGSPLKVTAKHRKGDPMMTDLQKLYLSARKGGQRGHYAALRHLARETGIDADSVGRCLDRAKEADAIDARRARRARKQSSGPRPTLVIKDEVTS